MDHALFSPLLISSLILWALLTAASAWFFSRAGNPNRKRLVLPWIAGVFAFLFLELALAAGLPKEAFVVLIPFSMLVTYLNVRAIRFCDKCGAYNPRPRGFRILFCRSCGTSLEKAV